MNEENLINNEENHLSSGFFNALIDGMEVSSKKENYKSFELSDNDGSFICLSQGSFGGMVIRTSDSPLCYLNIYLRDHTRINFYYEDKAVCVQDYQMILDYFNNSIKDDSQIFERMKNSLLSSQEV